MKRTELKRKAPMRRTGFGLRGDQPHHSPLKRTRPVPKPRSPINPFGTPCFFAPFDPDHECEGPVVRCHLIKEQWLRDRLNLDINERWEECWWVPGCNGFAGVGGHHWRFDQGKFKLNRAELPEALEAKAAEDERVAYKLDCLYGPLPSLRSVA